MIPRSQPSSNLSKQLKSPVSTNAFSGFSTNHNKPKPTKPLNPIYQRLAHIQNKLDEKSESYQFYLITYPPIPMKNAAKIAPSINVNSSQKPAYIPQAVWDAACSKANQLPYVMLENPLKPIAKKGFKELKDQFHAQTNEIDYIKKKVEEMKSDLINEQTKFKTEIFTKFQQISKNNTKISNLLMEKAKLDEKSVPSAVPFTSQEHELFDELQRLKKQISQPNQYKAALNSLKLKSDFIRESRSTYPTFDLPKNYDNHKEIIQTNTDAIEALVSIISKHQRSAQILKRRFQEVVESYHFDDNYNTNS